MYASLAIVTKAFLEVIFRLAIKKLKLKLSGHSTVVLDYHYSLESVHDVD